MNICLIMVCLAATPPERPYRVGVAHFPPMIIVDSETEPRDGLPTISGSDYDMFKRLVADPDISSNRFEYVIADSFGTLMNMVEAGEVDMAVDGISITPDRLLKMYFSQPYKNSGQRIMIPYTGQISIWSRLTAYVSQFFRLEILFSFIAFLINCCFWGVIIYLTESIFSRKRKDGIESNIRSIEDGALAAYDAGTTIGYGRFFPVTFLGQLVGAAAFFSGAIVVGNVISTLTTDKIVHHFEGEITSPEDLKGKTVAVVKGTTSEKVVKEYNPGKIEECDDFYKAVVQLRLGEVDAVVADDPVVLNYVKENPTHGSTAGFKFHPEDYGIAFAPDIDRDLVKKFSVAIARLRESGELALIEDKWFGE